MMTKVLKFRRFALNWVTDGIVWFAVVATASGMGMLLAAIVDDIRFRNVGGP